ncbi:hypothetical protein GGI15_004837 [Coemansia interrupta]|uniref:Uncharacterized protein n=1 Tax=Coemansia interrupta TaxID=1126814 RepID=A0A9W8H2I1_9FUNG|nr:hypothetical protein GGI15_004837 [Coemansia interrupta]
MLRSLLLPAPRSVFGAFTVKTGATAAACMLLSWHVLSIATGLRSPWMLYSLWMAVSSAALFYGRAKRDVGHVQWFATSAFIDIFVYAAAVPFEKEFGMTDVERCTVAMATNDELTMEYCLAHVHEISAIAYAIRAAALAIKVYVAAVARSYELECAGQQS